MIELRPYQTSLINRAREAMSRGVHSLIIEAPTGSGKTALTAMMIRTAASRDLNCWFVMHRVELLRQAMAMFKSVGVEFGVVAAGHYHRPDQYVQLATIGTLRRRLARLPPPRLIVYDECHHMAAKSWAEIHQAFPQAYHIGLTATPERLDGKGLGAFFTEMIKGPEIQWLIENGYLSKYRLAVPPGGVDADGVHKIGGDFNRAELAVKADLPTITGNAVAEYLKRARGKRALARGVSIVHSRHIAEQFNAAGIPARHVDGDTHPTERKDAMDSFIRGETLVLTNVDLFSEGVDVPGIECVIDLRPTHSLTMWLQFCGRALRPAPGKEHAVIIDMAGNLKRHGLPCQVREWSLGGRTKRRASESGGPGVMICPECAGAQFGRPAACAYCGFEFKAGEGREIREVDGELVEIDIAAERAKIERKREIGMARTLPELQELAKKYGYAPGWAWFRWNARQRKSAPRADCE